MDVNNTQAVQISDKNTSLSGPRHLSNNSTDNDDKINSSAAVEASCTVSSFDKLQRAVDKSVKRITSKQKILPYFKEHFQKVYRADSGNVLEIYKLMMSQLESMIKEDITMQLTANNVEELLCNLDKVRLENMTSQRKWRPSGSPTEDIKAHLQESSQKELQQLEKVLTALESQNKHLNECVAQSDNKLIESLKIVQDNCSVWEEAASVLSDQARQDLIDANMKLPSLAK